MLKQLLRLLSCIFTGTLLSLPAFYVSLLGICIVSLMFALFVCIRVYGVEGFPLWCMTWPRPHLEQSLAITTEERHSSMPLVSPNTVDDNVWEWQGGLSV